MHMIREEAQQESAEAAEQAGHEHRLDHDDEHDLEHDHAPPQHSTQQQQAGGRKSAGGGTGQGLLSRALRPPVLANRALSLHNLLDQSAVPELRPHLGTAAAAAVAAAHHQVRHPKCSLAVLETHLVFCAEHRWVSLSTAVGRALSKHTALYQFLPPLMRRPPAMQETV